MLQLVVAAALAASATAAAPEPATTARVEAGRLVLTGAPARASQIHVSGTTISDAGTMRAEATLAAANLVYLLLMAGGAVVLPAEAYGGLGDVVSWLPSGALGEAMRAACEGTVPGRDLLVLAAWALGGGVAAARWFKWE